VGTALHSLAPEGRATVLRVKRFAMADGL
jgi:hypothetical protein